MEDQLNVYLRFKDRDDYAFFAVYDGHGGGEASKYASRHVSEAIASTCLFQVSIKLTRVKS